MLFIPCRPLRNAPLVGDTPGSTSGALRSEHCIGNDNNRAHPIPLQWYTFEWAGLKRYVMVTTSIHCMAMQSYGRTGRPD